MTSLELQRLVVACCERFEAAWLCEARQPIEPFLKGLAPLARAGVLRELIALEVELRSERGDNPTLREYADRFPADAAAVEAAFASRRGATTADGARSRQMPLVEGYEVRHELGFGGMGVAYFAQDLKRDCSVVLKMMRSGREASTLELARFYLEASSIASLAHPNIVKIYEVGLHDGSPFLVLEYASGGNLKDLLGGSPQPPRWAAEVVRTIAKGLDHAHERGILHRDLKPSNILIMADGTMKVTDFGLVKFTRPMKRVFSARQVSYFSPERLADVLEGLWQENRRKDSPRDPSVSFDQLSAFVSSWREQAGHGEPSLASRLSGLTRDGAILGTPHYMAPEQKQFFGSKVGPCADIYALGAILYEIVSGRPPYSELSRDQILTREGLVPRPIEPRVSVDLEAITYKCLNAQAEHRYQSMSELGDDLGRFLDGYRARAVDSTTALAVTSSATPHPDGSVDTTATVHPDESPTTTQPAGTQSWWPFGRSRSRH